MHFKQYLESLERSPVVGAAYELYTGEPLSEGVADLAKATALSAAMLLGGAQAAPNASVGNTSKSHSTIQKKAVPTKQVKTATAKNLSFDADFQQRVNEIFDDIMKKNPSADYQIAMDKAHHQAIFERLNK